MTRTRHVGSVGTPPQADGQRSPPGHTRGTGETRHFANLAKRLYSGRRNNPHRMLTWVAVRTTLRRTATSKPPSNTISENSGGILRMLYYPCATRRHWDADNMPADKRLGTRDSRDLICSDYRSHYPVATFTGFTVNRALRLDGTRIIHTASASGTCTAPSSRLLRPTTQSHPISAGRMRGFSRCLRDMCIFEECRFLGIASLKGGLLWQIG